MVHGLAGWAEEAAEARRLAAPEAPQPAEEDEAQGEEAEPVVEPHRHVPEFMGEPCGISGGDVEDEQPVEEPEGEVPDRNGKEDAPRAERGDAP